MKSRMEKQKEMSIAKNKSIFLENEKEMINISKNML
jgi:hypothetical protein